jgi:prophage regulatory protein
MTTITLKPMYLDLPAVCSFVALSDATVQKLVRENAFPKPRQLSGRRVAWLVRELEAWAEACPVSSLAPPANTGQGRHRLKAA